jgi:Na+-translocating ferredoxin:NAD+ oxidoreductase RNF subunit RnfB
MNIIVISLITLGAIGAFAAIILYLVAKKFYVYEDPRIDEVEAILPSANCGACGFPGCRGFADACVKADDFCGLNCPVGGVDMMMQIADLLGKTALAVEPTVAVLLCNGTCENRPRTNRYDGVKSCAIAHNLYGGETACSYGCLSLGDCEVSCAFDALHINQETGLPEIIEEKCTSCETCVKACPRFLIQIRKKGPKSRRIYVSCMNKDKGAAAKKSCAVACIGCGKCVKVCPFEAITLEKNLAYIDDKKCRLCRKCAPECPTSAITELNFPPRKVKEEENKI